MHSFVVQFCRVKVQTVNTLYFIGPKQCDPAEIQTPTCTYLCPNFFKCKSYYSVRAGFFEEDKVVCFGWPRAFYFEVGYIQQETLIQKGRSGGQFYSHITTEHTDELKTVIHVTIIS